MRTIPAGALAFTACLLPALAIAQDMAAPIPALLGGDGEGFARVLAPRALRFPEDHGPHPDYRNEWWYFSGNLQTSAGRRFGFQLTFFRFALAPRAPRRESAWATRQVYMGHFAVSDIANARFHAFERFVRGAAGLAGARARPFALWIEDWTADAEGEHLFPLRLRAARDGVGLALRLESLKPLILQGEGGMSRKSATPGNASHYYSFTRLKAGGELTLDGARHAVVGSAWLDREWGTSVLAAGQSGWDWFGVQLSDGRDLMVYFLRERGGGIAPQSAGMLVEPDGEGRALARAQVAVEVLGRWTSPRDAVTYPAAWRLRVADAGIDLRITPRMADQEHRGTFRYWEGAAAVRGVSAERAVTGDAYVELVGYGQEENFASPSIVDPP